MQAPGGPDEDTSGGFKYGGWTAPYFNNTEGQEMVEQMKPRDLLLGRKTFDIFAAYWPKHAEDWPGINEVTKYVVSKTNKSSDWENSVFLSNVADIKKVKSSPGKDLVVWGSSVLIQSLLKEDLIDELWLKTFPVTLGIGKKLFGEGTIPAAFNLTKHSVTPSGVIFANYKRAGEVKTGTVSAWIC